MSKSPLAGLLAGLLTLAAAGLAWTLAFGPTGQPGARGRQPLALDLRSLPVTPFAGFATPFTDNLEKGFSYLGPSRDIDDDWPRDEVRIGLIGQFTGAGSGYGLAMQEGAEMAIEEANASGGYEGKKFVLVRRDDLADMGANANAMVKLIFDDRVRAVLGSVHSGNTHVGVRLALKCEVPQLTSISTDPTITEVGIPWAFRCLSDDRAQGRALAAYMFGKKDYRRIVLLNQANKYGRMGILELRSLAKKLGREILLHRQFTGGQKDFSALAKVVAQTAPDAIVLWGLYTEDALLVKALREAKVTAPILGGDALVAPEFIALAGAAAEGTIVTYPFDPDRNDAICREFVERYRTRKHGRREDDDDSEPGGAPNSFIAHGYDAARIVVKAIRSAGLNRARIRDALAATRDFPGVTGAISFDGTGNLIGHVDLAEVRGGRFVKLEGGADGVP